MTPLVVPTDQQCSWELTFQAYLLLVFPRVGVPHRLHRARCVAKKHVPTPAPSQGSLVPKVTPFHRILTTLPLLSPHTEGLKVPNRAATIPPRQEGGLTPVKFKNISLPRDVPPHGAELTRSLLQPHRRALQHRPAGGVRPSPGHHFGSLRGFRRTSRAAFLTAPKAQTPTLLRGLKNHGARNQLKPTRPDPPAPPHGGAAAQGAEPQGRSSASRRSHPLGGGGEQGGGAGTAAGGAGKAGSSGAAALSGRLGCSGGEGRGGG